MGATATDTGSAATLCFKLGPELQLDWLDSNGEMLREAEAAGADDAAEGAARGVLTGARGALAGAELARGLVAAPLSSSSIGSSRCA